MGNHSNPLFGGFSIPVMLDAILLSMRRATLTISNGNVVLIIENQPERQEGTLHCKWSGMGLFVGAINIQIY